MPTSFTPGARVAPDRVLDQRSLRRALRRATVFLVLALGLPALALLALVLFLLNSAAWVDHTDRVIAQTNLVERLSITMQAGFRGFRLTNDESVLATFTRARSEIEPALQQLAALVADSSPQSAEIVALKGDIDAWIKNTEASLALLRAGHTQDSLQPAMLSGRKMMDAVRTRAETFNGEEERLRAVRARTLHFFVTGLFVVLGLGMVAGIPALTLWLRRLLEEIAHSYQKNLEAAELRAVELRVTLSSIGDAVIATDAAGRVVFLNPAAEGLMGWANAEAQGRELAEVFAIFNEYTGAVAENPVTRVLRENIVVGLANHTVLRARDGREWPIEDSAAPIRGEDGQVRGVILVFHDVSEKREAERLLRASEQRFRFLNLLGEATRTLVEPARILAATTKLLGEHLRVSRCAYADVEADSEHFTILHDYTHECASTVGRYLLSLFGPHAAGEMHGGRTLVLREVEAEIGPDQGAATFKAIGIEALICCPLVKDGKLRAMMAVHQTTPRAWTDDEVSLVEEVVERCASTLERARAEAALNASEGLKSAILSTALDGFILMSHEGVILDWNDAAERIFGAARAQVLGKMLGEVVVPKRLREAHRHGVARYVATREARILGHRYELPALRADGSEFPCEISIAHIPQTEPPQFAGYVRDITERKKNEAALAASEARLRDLADSMPQIVWMARPDGFLDFYNRRWYEFTGRVAGEGGDESWLPILHPDDRQPCLDRWYASVRQGADYEMRYRFHDRETDEYRWFLGRAVPVRDGEGEIARWYGTCTDIDALVRAEEAAGRSREEAERAREKAEAASRAKDAFLAALSHELRTPLTPVLMAAAAMREDERLPADVREQLGMMERNIGLEARLIDDLLDLTRIARGEIHLRPQPCDAHSLIGLAVEIVRDDASGKGIALDRDFAAERSGLIADPARFQQVIWNLLRNAVKFTPRGGRIAIRTSDAGDWLHIEVADTGIGIPATELDKIFLPFEQGGLTGDHRFGGMGLGLAIARAIVDVHGGKIAAQSAGPNRGATFVVEFPGATDPPHGLPEAPLLFGDSRPANHSAAAMPSAIPSLRLLLVEDHEPTIQVLAKLLTRDGHRVTTATTIGDALATAATGTFDLVISDLGLPDGTGNELMEKLRDQYHLRGVALSGYGMDEDLERSRQSGFALHLIKPIDFSQLRRALATLSRDGDAVAAAL